MKAAFFLLMATAAAQNQTGGLTGVVVDSVTRQPVRKATVTVDHNGNTAGGSTVSRDPNSALTDSGGSFLLEKVAPGQVFITVRQSSYPAEASESIEIKPGEIAGPVKVELVPGAVISGHVLDEDGDPLNGCGVMPHPAAHLDRGVPMRGRPTSDIDGEYRIAGIPSGKYILSVECYQPVFEPRPFSAGPDPPPTRAYPYQYYPAAADEKSAEVIDLAPGVEKSGVDFQMKPAPVTQVRGTFAGDVWRGHENLVLQLMDVNAPGHGGFSSGSSVDSEKGTFEFKRVFPGSYRLFGFSNGDPANRIGVFQRVEVKDQPVQTVLEWRRATDLSGTVEADNHGNQTTSLSNISLLLTPDPFLGIAPVMGRLQDDGTFTIKSVLPGRWRIRCQGFDWFVKSVWAGSDEITDFGLDLSSGVAGPLRIVISNNTATVRGSGSPGQTVSAQMIFEDGSLGTGQGVPVDSNGEYVLKGLPPGKYRVTQGDNPDPNNAKEITVQEGETVTVDLKN